MTVEEWHSELDPTQQVNVLYVSAEQCSLPSFRSYLRLLGLKWLITFLFDEGHLVYADCAYREQLLSLSTLRRIKAPVVVLTGKSFFAWLIFCY